MPVLCGGTSKVVAQGYLGNKHEQTTHIDVVHML